MIRAGNRKRLLAVMTILFLLVAAWQWTPLREWLDTRMLIAGFAVLRENPLAPLLVIGAYLLGSLIAVPLSLLVVATLLVFGPVLGFCYALVGAELGAILTYGIGTLLGQNTVRSLAGSKLEKVSRQLARQGLLAVAIVRLLPIAPFTVVNVVAGASHIRFRDFALGSVLGLAPGILALALFSDRLAAVVQEPSGGRLAVLAAVVAVLVLAGIGAKRCLLKV
jgi:uncharacterized membrane protein YdjX (TVP38/TMEM64 family)